MYRKKIIVILLFAGMITLSAQNESAKIKAFNSSVDEESSYNYQKAIEPLLKIYNEFKDDYLINLRLGWLYYQKKDYSRSADYYQNAARLSENSIEAMLGITMPFAALKRWDDVKNIYEKILDKDEENYTANLNLGIFYFNEKNYLKAKSFFETVYENYPSDYSANLYLGWSYYYLGNKSKANKFFVDALIASPGDESAIEGMNLTK